MEDASCATTACGCMCVCLSACLFHSLVAGDPLLSGFSLDFLLSFLLPGACGRQAAAAVSFWPRLSAVI